MVSNGRPIENSAIKIIGEDMKSLPERHVGEIIIKSDCLFDGYYFRPEESRKAFIDGWFRTGDLGYQVNGDLFISGRKKDLIIVGGKNIYPQDLESLAMNVEGIHAGRVVAFGVFNEELGTEEVVLVAETDTDSMLQKDGLAENVRREVTQNSAIALRKVLIVDSKWLIKTSSGKIARSANRDKYLDEIKKHE